MLLPVLDDDKHYWVDEAEIEKLLRRGEGWLATHPDRDLTIDCFSSPTSITGTCPGVPGPANSVRKAYWAWGEVLRLIDDYVAVEPFDLTLDRAL